MRGVCVVAVASESRTVYSLDITRVDKGVLLPQISQYLQKFVLDIIRFDALRLLTLL